MHSEGHLSLVMAQQVHSDRLAVRLLLDKYAMAQYSSKLLITT
jgi:hypothetical protein